MRVGWSLAVAVESASKEVDHLLREVCLCVRSKRYSVRIAKQVFFVVDIMLVVLKKNVRPRLLHQGESYQECSKIFKCCASLYDNELV